MMSERNRYNHRITQREKEAAAHGGIVGVDQPYPGDSQNDPQSPNNPNDDDDFEMKFADAPVPSGDHEGSISESGPGVVSYQSGGSTVGSGGDPLSSAGTNGVDSEPIARPVAMGDGPAVVEGLIPGTGLVSESDQSEGGSNVNVVPGGGVVRVRARADAPSAEMECVDSEPRPAVDVLAVGEELAAGIGGLNLGSSDQPYPQVDPIEPEHPFEEEGGQNGSDDDDYSHLEFLGDVGSEAHGPDGSPLPLFEMNWEVEEEDPDWNNLLSESPDVSVLLFVTLLFTWQNHYKINNKATSSLFRLLRYVFNSKAKTAKIPSYEKSKKKFTPLTSGSKIGHVCPQCEYVYSESEPDVKYCPNPVCPGLELTNSDKTLTYPNGTPRWKLVNGKVVPAKKWFSWSLTEQLKDMVKWARFRHQMEPIPPRASENDAKHPLESDLVPPEARHYFSIGCLVFILALACDGFNPWRGVNYTMWFLSVRVLNYKTASSSSVDNVVTLGIICGPKEPKSLQFYLASFLPEFNALRNGGVQIPRTPTNSDQRVVVRMFAYLVALIGDYPALGKLLDLTGVGKHPPPFFFFGFYIWYMQYSI